MNGGQDAGRARKRESGGSGGRGASRPLPPYRVVLHNDDINELRYVVRTIIELTRVDSGRAMQITRAAHESGRALVLVTHKERAELYRDQFATRRLKVTVEPDGK